MARKHSATKVAPEKNTAPEATDEQKVTKSVVPSKYKPKYGKAGSVNDEIANALRDLVHMKDGIDLAALTKEAKANGIDLAERWPGKNIGMLRMNLGNVLRGKVKRGEYVVIGDTKFNENKKGQKAA